MERVQKISVKQHWKFRQQLKETSSMKCVRNGCEFETTELAAMTIHFNECILIDGETFYCNRCAHGPDTRAAIEEHITASHRLGTVDNIDESKDFSDSDDDAELGEESSESEGESGVDEGSERDGENEFDFSDDDDDDGWNAKGYKKKRIRRDWRHNEVLLNNCLDRKGI